MRLLAMLAILLSMSPVASAQESPFQGVIDDLFDHYFMLGAALDTSLGGEQGKVSASPSFSLQKPDVTPRAFAKGLRPSVGLTADVFETNSWVSSIGLGARGVLDFDQPFFDGGFMADTGAWGLTPTLVSQLWAGDERFGMLIESESALSGPLQGWRGSATMAVDLLAMSDQVHTNTGGASDFLIGASLSFVDQTYLHARYQHDESERLQWAPEAWSVGALWTYDLGTNLRLSAPIEFQQYLGAAADHRQAQGPSTLSAGLSLGYRFD